MAAAAAAGVPGAPAAVPDATAAASDAAAGVPGAPAGCSKFLFIKISLIFMATSSSGWAFWTGAGVGGAAVSGRAMVDELSISAARFFLS